MTKQEGWRYEWHIGAAMERAKYLSEVSELPAVLLYKQLTFELLDIQPGHWVLDVACGTGQDAIWLARRVGDEGKVIGVDINQGLIEQAQHEFADLDLPLVFRQADMCQLDFEANRFDGCRTDRALQHLEDPEIAIAEMVRVTRPGGRVVVSEPDWETRVVDSRDDRALTRKILNYWADTRKRGWIGHQLPALFNECGLVDIMVYPVTMIGPLREYDWELDSIALVKSAEGASRAGLITPQEAEIWLHNLREAERAGSFFAHLGGFIVSGQKPVQKHHRPEHLRMQKQIDKQDTG